MIFCGFRNVDICNIKKALRHKAFLACDATLNMNVVISIKQKFYLGVK